MRKGETIIVALYYIYNNPKVQENPNRFDPNRQDTDTIKKRS